MKTIIINGKSYDYDPIKQGETLPESVNLFNGIDVSGALRVYESRIDAFLVTDESVHVQFLPIQNLIKDEQKYMLYKDRLYLLEETEYTTIYNAEGIDFEGRMPIRDINNLRTLTFIRSSVVTGKLYEKKSTPHIPYIGPFIPIHELPLITDEQKNGIFEPVLGWACDVEDFLANYKNYRPCSYDELFYPMDEMTRFEDLADRWIANCNIDKAIERNKAFYCAYSGNLTEGNYYTFVEGYGNVADENMDFALADGEIFYCGHCNEYFAGEAYKTADNGSFLCEHCYTSHYFTCEECGRVLLSEDWYDEYGLCTDCSREDSNIHDYSYKPTSIFHRATGEQCTQYYGIELEVADLPSIKNCAKNVLNSFDGENDIYLKKDGSVNDGFEMVTHPMTLNWIKENHQKFENALEAFNVGEKIGRDEGLHIHVSKKPLKENSEHTVAALSAIVEENYSDLLKFHNRKANIADKWAIRRNPVCYYELISSDDRYRAINTQNWNTVEYRLPNSTTYKDGFFNTIGIFDFMVSEAKKLALLWEENFIEIADGTPYEELKPFVPTNIVEMWENSKPEFFR